ncbi:MULTISPECIES: maleylpyruvate isomerase family mycothiol-dependent enzyme [unclassified Crossiella]|uniref:maleylpyruvate isomerase family mycothiol-dependent enzyme n=1 Tax=unclassified Crossiella TaxID=2620835 RepID=UPI001FFF2AD8|nr:MULTISPECIES: maleylpyruvate isomerase family mycothiol-dependent enzyme [unclassified Crossiella]MCK2237953.1 maleylpyruvate isomerase family mycothiol-dependent enzyme [Crossiella sp. S99.2]MCK2255236.1 maleylpyruvate isomerase family mycothiol-dependent enzyme [Crossiella sp. S99.1]
MTSELTMIDYPAVVAAQIAAITAAARRPGVLDLPVPSCPGWTVTELVTHAGEVCVWWTHALAEGGLEPEEEVVQSLATPGADLLGWWEARSAALVEVLRATPSEAVAWCWWRPEERAPVAEVAGWVAHELLTHRWDAENAVGVASPVPAELGAAGITEFALRMLPAQEAIWAGSTGLIRLHATDLDRVWDFRANQDGPCLLAEPGGEPAVLVAATAGELDLLLWRRLEADAVTITGDAALATAFLDWVDFS